MNHIRTCCLVAFIVLLFACTQERTAPAPHATPSQSGAGDAASSQVAGAAGDAASLAISPLVANRRTILGISTAGFDPASARIEWLVNGNPYPSEQPTQLSCASLTKGSSVQARVLVNGRTVQSNVVEIKNTPPVITDVRMAPHASPQGRRLAVEVQTADPDGDEVSCRYAWTRNGAPAGSGQEIGVSIQRGDQVNVEVTPYDGQDWGETVKSTWEISNIPPTFVQNTNFVVNGNTLVYQARVSDSDGDTVAFSLESPPAGMTINGQTGELRWTMPAGFRGEQAVTILADDSHGGIARYTATFRISE